MKKFLIESYLKNFSEIKTTTLTAQEDLMWYRLNKLLIEKQDELNKDKSAIAEQARKDGVVFLETGQPDLENSNKEVLDKANEKTTLLINEDFDAKVLTIEILNKIKVENEIPSGQYNYLLELFLKEEQI
jgi:uncharacterized HAD superfamily protein